jgi:pilus assembly protein CpaD
LPNRSAPSTYPVASGDRALTISMREIARGAAQNYRSSASGAVRIMVPVGSANAGAASVLAPQVADILRKEGVPGDRIISSPYHVSSPEDAAPIRIAFMAMTASTGECGRWPDDLLANTSENKHYANFGCASQNNLAAQISNPGDLIAPRGMTPIDAERRSTVIEAYRTNGAIAGN